MASTASPRDRLPGLAGSGRRAGLAGRASVKRATRPDPTRPDPTRPDPTRPDPTRPDLLGQHPAAPGRRRRSPSLGRFRSRLLGPGPARCSLAVALALLAAAAATPAQTSVKLVSTTGQTVTATNANRDFAQAFTTGSNSGGYVLTRVDWKFKRDGEIPITFVGVLVGISQDSSGSPGAEVGVLTDPASLPSDGLAQFTAPGGGIVLAANTTYFAIFNVDAGFSDDLHATTSDAEDAGTATGWSIADSHLRRGRLETGWASAFTATSTMAIAVHGYPLAPKLVGNTSQSRSGSQTGFHDWAQPFTTGSNASGYKLTRAEIRMLGGSGTAPTYTASIHSDSSNSPGASLGTLTNPAAWPSSAGPARHFAPSGGINLAANTTYWLVFDITANASIAPSKWLTYRTTEDDEDSGASAGWSIGNDNRSRVWNATTWGSPFSESLVLSLHGNPRPPPMVSNTGHTAVSPSDAPFGQDRAQQFTTGSGTGGYKLTRLQLRLKSSATTAPVYSVSIQGDSSDLPDGTALGTLTTSATLTASYALVEFAASGSGISLSADTDYWVVIDVSTGDADTDVQARVTPLEDAGALPGWSIGNGHRWRLNSASAWEANASNSTLGIAVYGTSVDQTAPAFESATVAGTLLSVTFDENMYSGSAPAGTAFALSGGRSGTGTAAVSGATVSVTLGSAVALGETVTVSYSAPDSGKLQDNAGNLAESFSGQSVTNLTPPPPATPPPPPLPPDPPPPDTDPDPQQPQTGPSGGSQQARPDPQPLQLALWTDKPGYRAGETVRLYRTLDPHDDSGRYRTFAWLERSDGSERRYLAPLSAEGTLREELVDASGLPASAEVSGFLSAADRELAWQGPAPAPGLWQFVLELRPGSGPARAPGEDVPVGARRAWTRFVVAERSLLLNRRGFDREVRSDLTLRSDTVYHLLHQLFVHDGATLTIEPGTLVQAWGPSTAIIVERGGRIVAEGTPEAPVVLTCSAPAGWREPGCWAGLRILGRAPVTRLEGVAPGVLPAGRPVYGGTDAEDSSGALRYVRVEFAGAGGDPDDAEAAGPAIGLYGAGSGTVLDHVQARASLGDGFAFHGGTAVCEHCVASGSGASGLSWRRGWRGGATHLYVQQGRGGLDALDGGNDEQGYDLEPRSLPTLSNVTLVHASPFGSPARRAVALRLSTGSGVQIRDLLATRFGGGAIAANGRSALLFGAGESWLSGALLYRNGGRPLRGVPRDAARFISRDPRLRDVRDFPNPDPRPKADSPALREFPPDDREIAPGWNYVGAFGRQENWLEKWTVFGPESAYDLRQRDDEGN